MIGDQERDGDDQLDGVEGEIHGDRQEKCTQKCVSLSVLVSVLCASQREIARCIPFMEKRRQRSIAEVSIEEEELAALVATVQGLEK